MKKTNNIKRIVSVLVFVICLLLFNLSCGLDVLYVIGSPFSIGGIPNENSSYEDKFFIFRTNEIADDIIITGTDVYYKIYDNLTKLQTDISYINNIENYSSSKDKLFSKKFAKLTTDLYNEVVLVPKQGVGLSRTVKIRLTDYQDSETFSARILVNDDNLYGSANRVIPVRSISEKKTFNFGRAGIKDGKPLSGDEDSDITAASSSGVYFVAAYALTVGFDSAFTPCYSEPLYLGYIKIDSNEVDN